jgi:hypothetical protein
MSWRNRLSVFLLSLSQAIGAADGDPLFELDVAGGHDGQLVEGAVPARQIPVQVVVLPGVQLGGQGVQPVAQPVLGDQLIKMGKSIMAGLVSLALMAIMEPKLKHWNQGPGG